MARITRQRDLARRLKLTQSTVSRALRGYPGISGELRARVLEAARETGYALPNGAVFHDANGARTGIICLDIPNSDEWQERLIAGAITAARETGHEIVVSPHVQGDLPQVVKRRQVDGLVRLMSQSDYILGKAVEVAPVPTVSVLYPVPGGDVVGVDHFGSARMLGLHLAGLWPGVAAYVGHSDPIGQARYHGVRCGLEKGGTCLPPELVRTTNTLDAMPVMALVGELLDLRGYGRPEHQFTLIAFYNDHLARHAIQVIRSRGLRVPEDVGVSGYDDVPMPIEADIRLVTVHMPLEELGAAAVRRVHWHMSHPDARPLHWLLDAPVVGGNSVVSR